MTNTSSRTTSGSRSNTTLPWVISAILGVLCIGLIAMYSLQSSELTKTKTQLDQTKSQLNSTRSQTGTLPGQAGKTTDNLPDEQTKLLLSLARKDPNDMAAMGSVDAPVVLIEWSDFRCPFCARFATDTHQKLLPYVESGSLRIERRDLVMFGEESHLAASGIRAAGMQGKYWQFYDAAFAEAPTNGKMSVTLDKVLQFAQTAGVPDLDKFQKDLSATSISEAISADTSEARGLGITSAPFFVVNDHVVSGAQPTETFIQLIESMGAHK